MKKVLLASVLGGLTLFIWGAISWMAFPFHGDDLRPLTNEDAVVAAFKAGNATTGTYRLPSMARDANRDAVMAKTKAGPVAIIQYTAEGYDPMNPMYYVKGLLIYIIAMWIAVMMLSKISYSLATYGNRVRFMMMIGVILAVACRLNDWAFIGYPTKFTLLFAADDIIGWTLAGLVVARFTKPELAKR